MGAESSGRNLGCIGSQTRPRLKSRDCRLRMIPHPTKPPWAGSLARIPGANPSAKWPVNLDNEPGCATLLRPPDHEAAIGTEGSVHAVNTQRLLVRACLLLGWAAMSATPSGAGPFSSISDSEKLTAVSSSAHNGYVRTRQADGSFRPETFALGEGGVIDGFYTDQFLRSDPTIDNVTFPEIAQMLAGPLESQNYVPTPGPESTNLLIMVFWGTTIGGANTIDGNFRDLLNYENAKLLGFDSEGSIQAMTDPSTVFYGRSFRSRMLDEVHADVLSAIEVNRYYVILRAFDFQSAWKQKKLKLLWETRFSLSERRHDFERDLPGMAQDASSYFGQDSYGLVLKPIPEGHVHVGEVASLDDQSETDEGGSFDPRSGVVGDWQRTSPGPRLIIHIDPSGKSTFESPGQHVAVPARVTTSAGAVTVKVPGWDLIIRGTLKGNRITGTILQYDKRNSLTLTKIGEPPEAGRGHAGDVKSPADTPEK